MNKLAVVTLGFCMCLLFSTWAFAKSPDCAYPEGWPSSMAFTYLKNAGLVNNEVLDFTKTTTKRLASEKIDKDLYRQVHLVRFFKKTGEQVVVITVNDASHEECSMSGVDVYVVSKQLGDPK